MSASHDSKPADGNIYLQGSILTLCLRTAAPAITMMLVNGLFTIVDTWFVGVYAGALELTSVTIMFPLYMVVVSAATLVSGGFASIYARFLGAGDMQQAGQSHGQAIMLSIVLAGLLILAFALGGRQVATMLANGDVALARPGYEYMAIVVYTAPIMFVLSLQFDALRSEGRIRFMFFASVFSVLLNIAMDAWLVAVMGYGAVGSAVGTVLTEIIALAIILYCRRSALSGTVLSFKRREHWLDTLALGMPSAINYMGLAVSSTITLWCIQVWLQAEYDVYAAVYGIITRLLTFSFMPLLGLALSFQAIVGNNYGAGMMDRSNRALQTVMWLAFGYCLLMQALFFIFRHDMGPLFVEGVRIAEVMADILPLTSLGLFLLGPLMIISFYFQAIGDAKRAGLLGLSRTWFFAIPLTALLPLIIGPQGIWYAGVSAEILMLLLTFGVLRHRSKRHEDRRFGLFEPVRAS